MRYNYSFIIPHKNCPDLLQRCVDSIPERDDVQIIVVDDNSASDKKPYLDCRKIDLVLLNLEQSNGAGRARNVGLQYAKGKWVLFADADDYYSDGFINILDNYVSKTMDILYFNFIYKDGRTGDVLSLHCQKHFLEYDGSKKSLDQVKFHHNMPWTKMISREYISRNGFLFEETINGNDILFSMTIGRHTDNVLVEKRPLYVYLRNDNSLFNSKDTPQTALCRLTHRVKLNYFYKSIGYPEWRLSIIDRILKYSIKVGFSFVILLLKSIPLLYRCRKDWMNM